MSEEFEDWSKELWPVLAEKLGQGARRELAFEVVGPAVIATDERAAMASTGIDEWTGANDLVMSATKAPTPASSANSSMHS